MKWFYPTSLVLKLLFPELQENLSFLEEYFLRKKLSLSAILL